MAEEEKTSVAVETPIGKLGVTGASLNLLFTVAAAVAGFLMIYFIHEHKNDSKAAMQETTAVIRESLKGLHDTNRQILEVQREHLCILALPQEKREHELVGNASFCKRIAR